MKELTRAEAQVMRALWKLNGAFVKDLQSQMKGNKLAYNTISTQIRTLVVKGYVQFEKHGKSHKYIPIVSKEEYLKFFISNTITNYFDDSAYNLLEFIVKGKKTDLNELDDMIKLLRWKKKN
ncbi:MAG: BlaI/MecI/CopY family transcriptional regulator [Bacteroidetes bacterium]|nr:MAG: BlaI/MecI/CopY family transcriptional regulator [Bacteroidota bacterium]